MSAHANTRSEIAVRHAPPAVERCLRELRCHCGAPATHIFFTEAGRCPSAVDRRARCFPRGEASRAVPSCEEHLADGYCFTVEWAIHEWCSWLDHLESKGFGGHIALLGLVAGDESPWV